MSCNVRVEVKRLSSNASKAERDKAIQIALRILKRACNEAGVTKAIEDKQFFVRKTDLRRRKKMMKLHAQRKALEEGDTNSVRQ